MSSLVIKVGSLIIKTLSKPIANRIKAQAREHETFRRGCVVVAQGIHRWDMRFRIGLLQDTREIEKQIAKDAAEAQKPPTVKTEAEAKKEEARAKDPDREKSKAKKPKIKPLPEAKAIELGANFVSETFLLAVGIALVLFENARRGRQEFKKDEGLNREIQELREADRLKTQALLALEKEVLKLRPKDALLGASGHRILPEELREPEEEDGYGNKASTKGWFSWVPSLNRADKKEEVQSKQAAVIDAPSVAEVKPTDPAPSTSTIVLSKILPRTRARDAKPRNTNHPSELDTENINSEVRIETFTESPKGQ